MANFNAMPLTLYDPLAFLCDIRNNAILTTEKKIIWVIKG